MVQGCQEGISQMISKWNAKGTLADESILAAWKDAVEREDTAQSFLSAPSQSIENAEVFLQRFTETSLRLIILNYDDLSNYAIIIPILSQLIETCEKYSILEAVLRLTEQIFKQKCYSIREEIMLYFIQLLDKSANNFFNCSNDIKMSIKIANQLLQVSTECNIANLDLSIELNIRLSMFLWKNFTRVGNISFQEEGIAELLSVTHNIFLETIRHLKKACGHLQSYILGSISCHDKKCQLHQFLPQNSIPTQDALQSRLKLTRFLHRAFHKQFIKHLENSSQNSDQVTEAIYLSDALTLLAALSLLLSRWKHLPELTQDSHLLLEAILDSVHQFSGFFQDSQFRISNSSHEFIPFLESTFSYPPEALCCSIVQPLLKLALALVNGNLTFPTTQLKDVMDHFRDCFYDVFSMELISFEYQQDIYSHAVDTILMIFSQANSESAQNQFQIELFRCTLDNCLEMRQFSWLLWEQLLSAWESNYSSKMIAFLISLATSAPWQASTRRADENELTGSIFVQRMQELVISLMNVTASSTVCLQITERVINHICKLGPQHEFSVEIAYQLQFMEKFVMCNCLSFVIAKEKDEWITKYLPICLECVGALLDLTTGLQPVPHWPGILRVLDISTLVLLAVTLERNDDELASTISPLCLEILKVLADCVKEEKRLQNHPKSKRVGFQLSVDFSRPYSSSQRLLRTCLSIIARSKSTIQCNQNSNFVRLLAYIHALLTLGNAKLSISIAIFLQKACADVQVDEKDLTIVNQLIGSVIHRGYSQSPLLQTIWLDTISSFARASNLLDATSSTFLHYFTQKSENGRHALLSFLETQELPLESIRKSALGVLSRKRPRSRDDSKPLNPLIAMETQLETLLSTCKQLGERWETDKAERNSIQEMLKHYQIMQKLEQFQTKFSNCV
uniref:Uncharacterized protein AlNc14C202G8722 n=1 Tax=Albugo laibachii Nc14 TaxID=890382 RepID=F0WQR2_9STRA|nr:conserved hypothetical protein [Albugo laibachii Nc14]CCA25332.1 conserved hypothetical protein [Albugo laibachii Nc14]|eukprot:CCA25332.1 conserved hypothetical protein [Albugo laibachii Nc14]